MWNEVIVSNLQEYKTFVNEFKKQLKSKQLILLNGPMGVGKTQFVQYFAEECAEVMSPTFAILNRYELSENSLDHIDLYRLKDDADLECTGFWDVFDQDRGWIIIEWANRLPNEVFPRDWPIKEIFIEFIKDQPNKRKIKWNSSNS